MFYGFINSPTIRVRFRDRAVIESESCQFLLIERSRKVSLWRIFRGCKLSIWISQTLVIILRTPVYVPPTSRFEMSGHARYREAVKHASLRTRLTTSRLAGCPGREIHFPLVKSNNPDPVRILSRRQGPPTSRERITDGLSPAVSSLSGMKPTN